MKQTNLGRVLRGTLLATAVLAGAGQAWGDRFHLKDAGVVEGQLIGQEDGRYVIRTTVGTVRLPTNAVERIEPGPTVFDEYEQRLAAAPQTAEGQTALAEWCGTAGLSRERRLHLERALELDTNYAPARRALGYVRVGRLWVDGRSVERQVPSPDATTQPADDTPNDPEQLAEAIQSEWLRRIQAIQRSLLSSTLKRLRDDGRRKILEIRDPLAVLPLAQVLSAGSANDRLLLVEAMQPFAGDEATLNLAVLGLVDPCDTVSNAAFRELKRRNDPRVVAQYREALKSGDGRILRRAAMALGYFDAAEATPDLIDVLTDRGVRLVPVTVDRYVGRVRDCFDRGTDVYLDPDRQNRPISLRPRIGVSGWGRDIKNEWQYREVKIFRTEVMEALKKITGQNFGFDAAAWRRWYEESQT